MHTLGYRFRPWRSRQALADGPSILRLRPRHRERGGDRPAHALRPPGHARRVVHATRAGRCSVHDRRAADLRLPLRAAAATTTTTQGYLPEFPDLERFEGKIVHPQYWPEDLDYARQEGRGDRQRRDRGDARAGDGRPGRARDDAPALADLHLSIPSEDAIANGLRRAARRPARVRDHALEERRDRDADLPAQPALSEVHAQGDPARRRRALPPGYDVDTHFNPRYGPWDQRLCLVPDGDLFKAIPPAAHRWSPTRSSASPRRASARVGRRARGRHRRHRHRAAICSPSAASSSTSTASRSRCPSGMAYKGMMLSGVPNFAFTIGYTNASWTLKADLVAEYVCRLLRTHGPRRPHAVRAGRRRPTVERRPLLDFQAGYVQRSIHEFPQGGASAPWKLGMSYPQRRRHAAPPRTGRRRPAVHPLSKVPPSRSQREESHERCACRTRRCRRARRGGGRRVGRGRAARSGPRRRTRRWPARSRPRRWWGTGPRARRRRRWAWPGPWWRRTRRRPAAGEGADRDRHRRRRGDRRRARHRRRDRHAAQGRQRRRRHRGGRRRARRDRALLGRHRRRRLHGHPHPSRQGDDDRRARDRARGDAARLVLRERRRAGVRRRALERPVRGRARHGRRRGSTRSSATAPSRCARRSSPASTSPARGFPVDQTFFDQTRAQRRLLRRRPVHGGDLSRPRRHAAGRRHDAAQPGHGEGVRDDRPLRRRAASTAGRSRRRSTRRRATRRSRRPPTTSGARARSPRTTSPATGRSSARRRASTTRASTSGAWARRRAAARPSARR